MFRSQILPEIETLDPERDCCRIVYLNSCYDFPFDNAGALEFALFRTYAVPSISNLLDRTGEFGCRAQKRYDDTDLILSEIICHGYDSQRGKAALRRMNQIHGRFEISNPDYLYVLSTFIYEPIRWNSKFGWRPFVEKEKQAMFWFWREVGKRMGISDIPEDYHTFELFNRSYEDQHFELRPSNQRVGEATCRLFLSWGPDWARPLGRRVIHALMDDPLRRAFGMPRAPFWVENAASIGLRLRARMLPFLPRRNEPVLRTRLPRAVYPNGYEIEALGPPPVGCRGPIFEEQSG